MDSTVRYLGVDIEDALTLAEGIDLQQAVPTDAVSGSRPNADICTLSELAFSSGR
jgi:hypothetical protein